MALTVPETIGFCEEVGQFMNANSAALSVNTTNPILVQARLELPLYKRTNLAGCARYLI